MTSKKSIINMIQSSNITEWYIFNEMFDDNFGMNYIFSPDSLLCIEVQYLPIVDIDYDYKEDSIYENIYYTGPKPLHAEIKYDGNLVEVLDLMQCNNIIYPIPDITDEGKDFITKEEFKLCKIFSSRFIDDKLSEERLNQENVYIK